MKSSNAQSKRRLSPEEISRKKSALHEIKHLMIKCYPDTRSKRARKQILSRVSDIFLQEFGSQKDEIRNQIIRRLFNHGRTEKMVLDINGKKAEFEVLRYAKLRTLDGKPVDTLTNSDLPQHFREGVMAALFEREVEKRLAEKQSDHRPVIDITPKKQESPRKLQTLFAGNWLRLLQPFRLLLTN